MKSVRLAVVLAVGSLLIAAVAPAVAEEQQEKPASLEERLHDLDQKIRILERNNELNEEESERRSRDLPRVGAGKGGFFISSPDGAYQLKLRGYIQADGRFFFADREQNATNSILLRRVRPIFEGTVGRYFDFRIMPDFGDGKTVLQDAYLEARYWPAIKIRAGKFKAPFGLERLQSGTDTLFVERALPTSLAPNRDLGLQLSGEVGDGVFSYAVGAFNGVPDGGSSDGDSNDDKEFTGRIFAHPFKNSDSELLEKLGVGLAGSWGNQQGTTSSPNLPSFKSSGQQTFFGYLANGAAAGTVIADGIRYRLSPQLSYYNGPFGLLGEYVLSSQEVRKDKITAELKNSAWQVAVSWLLTDDEASFKGVNPKRPFDPGNGLWGAVELKARYNELAVDADAFPLFADPKKSARKAKAWGAGFNWYLNRNVKVVADYEQTGFDRGRSTGDREKEKVFLSRVQISF